MARSLADPDIIKDIVLALLRADDAYRRDLGAFGPTDRRTIGSEANLWHARQLLRSWYAANFGSADLSTPPANRAAGE